MQRSASIDLYKIYIDINILQGPQLSDVVVFNQEAPEEMGRDIALGDLQSPLLIKGLAQWEKLRAGRRYPARAQIAPRDFAELLRNLALVQVLDEGNDYEYRIVGDAHVEAQGISFLGKRVSDIEGIAPGYGTALKNLYDRVREGASPKALRGWLQRGKPLQQIFHHESVFLPLGPDESVVDHLLIITDYTRGSDLPTEEFGSGSATPAPKGR